MVAAPGPCVVDPVAGYTGLENRLYRVEVHRAGTLGGATKASFVWSRDNASPSAGVTNIVASATGSVLTATSTGRDAWTRFEKDQVLELLDDDIEFGRRDRGTGGQLLTITEVVHATAEIHVKEDLTTYLATPGPNPRVVRWDTDPKVPGMATERDTEPGVPRALEEGIEVTFVGSAADTVHVGDYWVFAARTADGTVEILTEQAPRGIHHHYMRLGMVTAATPTTVEDCRVKWPPDCDCEGGCECDQCVTPESHASGDLTIQDAIDAVVAAGGGTVCLHLGRYDLDRGLVLTGGLSVHIRGKGFGTQIWFQGSGPALAVSASFDVAVRDLTIVTERDKVPADGFNAIEVAGCVRVALEDLYVFEDAFSLLVFLEKGSHPRPHGAAIALVSLVADLDIERCVLAGGYCVAAPDTTNRDLKGGVLLARLGIRENWLFASRTGIRLGEAGPTSLLAAAFDQITLTDNSIYGCTDHGIVLALLQVAGAARVAHNVVVSRGTGLWVSTDDAYVEDNTVTSLQGEGLGHGIVLASQDKAQLSRVTVGNNAVRARDVGILLDGELEHVTVDHNRLRSCGNGIVMSLESRADDLRVTDNSVIDVVPPERVRLAAGIGLVRATDAVVANNLVRGVGQQNEAVDAPNGILTLVCPHVRVSGNTVQDIGFEAAGREASGIASVGGFQELDILHNTVHQDLGRDGSPMSWFALDIGRTALKTGAWSTHALVGPKLGFWLGLTSVSALDLEGRRMRAGVSGNTFATDGISPSTIVMGPILCLVSDNRVVHGADPGAAVMFFQLETLAFTSNHVESGRLASAVEAVVAGSAVDVTGASVPAFTAVGNLTAGDILLNGSPLPPPWDALNVRLT